MIEIVNVKKTRSPSPWQGVGARLPICAMAPMQLMQLAPNPIHHDIASSAGLPDDVQWHVSSAWLHIIVSIETLMGLSFDDDNDFSYILTSYDHIKLT